MYCNGDTQRSEFNGTLHFDTSLVSHKGNDSWVEKTLFEIKACLSSDKLPEPTKDCDYCEYWAAVKSHVDKFDLVT